LTWRRVGAVIVGLGFLSWAVNVLVAGTGSLLPVPWLVPIALIVVAGAALWLGWAVHQYRAGKRPGLDPLRAAQTAMFSQAAALTGAALVGVYGGYIIALAADWGHPPRRALVVAAILATVAAGILLAAGWTAERWCATSDDDDEHFPGASPEAA
jgi:hypothetical protein